MQQYKIIAVFSTAAFLFFSQQMNAQISDSIPLLTLKEIWDISELHNRQLKLSELNHRESQLIVDEAKDKLLPELSVGGDFKLNSKFLLYHNGLFSSPQDVPVSSYGYGVGYSFNLNLYRGGKEKRNVKIKQEEVVLKQYEFDLQKNNIKYNTAVAYCDLYKFLQFREFISAEISTEKKQLALIESLNKNGVVMKSDVLRTSVKLSQLELNVSDIEKKIEITKQRLNILMGRDSEVPFDISDQNDLISETAGEPRYADYLDIALNNSPQYRIAYTNVKLSDLNSKQIKSDLLPRVSLYSNYNYTFPQISFYPYSNDLWGFGQTGIKVQFSIENLYKSKHSIAHARNLLDQQKEKVLIKKEEITVQVKEAYLQQRQALESVEMAEKNIIKSSETVRVIRNSYLNQESLLTDLLDAENQLLEAKFNLTTAKVNLKLSHIRLLAITGIL
ncbi:TolC family protein (plasmid) [Chryseobacterium panacisoli]|uniref:TolC family protein n=1 Tax=Chryseobacterium panacisoli TaxID=1807141 RepID=A0A5D8ZU48_9FLAO|nr:TolC family protein [Chryseobacterium panacisoli]TZF98459.1 TolC family protein [Chryseobacterium panacisoli]